MGGSPGGQRRECFSRNFLPSRESLISCNSSIIIEVPVRRASALVDGLVVVGGLGEFLLLSELDLWLGCKGMGYVMRGVEEGEGKGVGSTGGAT